MSREEEETKVLLRTDDADSEEDDDEEEGRSNSVTAASAVSSRRTMQRRGQRRRSPQQQNNVLVFLTGCFVLIFTTALLLLVLRQWNQQAASFSEAVSSLSLSLQQTQDQMQQQTQQLEHKKQQNQQQPEISSASVSSSQQLEEEEEKDLDLLSSSLSQQEPGPVEKVLSSAAVSPLPSSLSSSSSENKNISILNNEHNNNIYYYDNSNASFLLPLPSNNNTNNTLSDDTNPIILENSNNDSNMSSLLLSSNNNTLPEDNHPITIDNISNDNTSVSSLSVSLKNNTNNTVSDDTKIVESAGNINDKKDNDKKGSDNEEKYAKEHACLSSNVTFSDLFCQRMVRVSHKMGYELGYAMFRHTPHVDVTQLKRESDKQMNQSKMDYRDILIVRDMYESIVSGYLYHKSGRECHLSPDGEPWHRKPGKDGPINLYWDAGLVKTQDKVKRFVGTNNTSNSKIIDVHRTRPNQTMCEYLEETAESGGKHGVELAMLTYMHNVFKVWYMGLLINIDRVVGKIGDDQNRTLFVCFEELEDSEQQPHVVQTILHFLFPADARGQQPRQRQRHLTATEPPAPPRAYSGGHATDHDPQVRAALKDIIRKLDVEYFDGVIAKYQAIIGCTYR